jgi:hypothetical protein
MIGAVSGFFLQVWHSKSLLKRRWDERTLTAYATFLRKASATFDSAISSHLSKRTSMSGEGGGFNARYGRLTRAHEELVLLDPGAHGHCRRMLWTLWDANSQLPSLGPDTLTGLRRFPWVGRWADRGVRAG